MEGEPDFASYRQRSATGFVCTQTLFLYHKAQACVEQGDVARLFCRKYFTELTMAFLAVCAALLAALPMSPATASNLDDVFKLYQTGVEAHISARKLLQDSSVCGFNEYFCGDTDMVSDTAYNAVVAGNCYNDTIDTGSLACTSLLRLSRLHSSYYKQQAKSASVLSLQGPFTVEMKVSRSLFQQPPTIPSAPT